MIMSFAANGFAALAAVAGLAAGPQQVVFTAHVDGGTVQGIRAAGADGFPVSRLVFIAAGRPPVTLPLGEHIDAVDGGACAGDTCLVTGGTGAHSESAVAVRVAGGLTVTDAVLDGSPSRAIRDLDGDGTPDVVLQESTYEPDYATAPRYWVSYELVGGALRRTGCTAPSTAPRPVPSAPLTGSCYQAAAGTR